MTSDGKTVFVFLTQEESLSLREGKKTEVQLNWTYLDLDGETVKRAATKIREIELGKQLIRRVITCYIVMDKPMGEARQRFSSSAFGTGYTHHIH